ncbi:MAG: glycosyltransferase family 4 protein [Endomicrobium sp.]|jgi:glycosyltransferase involved in cell wall biosynthesis|nr:glycosyltransferase family 4 protein [Endomicrobium sp.]
MKYRVLHIFSSKTAGGAEKKTLFLADKLQKSGLLENVMAVRKGTYMYEQSLEKNLETVNFKAGGSFDPFGIIRLIKIIKKYKIDIVHVHQGKLYWQSVIARIFCHKIKIVFHRRQDTRHGFYSRLHYKFADAVITVSKAVADGLIKYERVPKNKVFTVYNGLDFERFDINAGYIDIMEKYNLKGKQVVGTVGAIVDFRGKGQIYLIEAAKNLRKDYPDLRYLIVGGGAGIEKQKDYAKSFEVDDIVFFVGYQEHVQKFILSMDVFCLLSWDTEGVGNVLIEAQALGKPVIGTNVGGIPETFINERTGILIQPSNTDETVQAIKQLIGNSEKAKKFGLEGKKFVESKFTIDNMVKGIVDVYDKIMADKK